MSPDFAMCQNPTCPSRDHCRRHEASGTRPNPRWQTYSGFSVVPGMLRCSAYVPAPHAPERGE